MLSIAFGAPHFCDKVAAAAIEEYFPGQFFTFVNGRDPVPRLLHNLPLTILEVASKINDGVGSRTRLALFGSLCGNLLHFFATGKVVKFGSSDEPQVCELFCQSWEDVDRRARDAEKKSSVYAPIGTFVFLGRDSGSGTKFEELMSTSEAIGGFLSDINLKDECFDDHKCGSYLRAFLDISLIKAVDRGQDVRGFYHNASPRQPEVASAVCRAHDGGGSAGSSFITITGKNLFLLREVAWNGVRIEATEVVSSSFEELQIFHPLSHEELSVDLKTSTTLSVKTAFGACSSFVIEEYLQGHSKCVDYLLGKLVLDLVLLAKIGIHPVEAELNCLKLILQKFGGMSSAMSLETILASAEVDKIEAARRIADVAALNIVKPLVFEFRKGNDAEDSDVLGETWKSAARGARDTLAAAAVGASPAVFGASTAAAVGTTVLGSATGAYSIARTSLVWLANFTEWIACEALDRLDPIVRKLVCKWMMSSYDDFLHAAVKEARLWNGKPPSGNNEQPRTEGDLVVEVNGAPGTYRDNLRAAISDDREMQLTLSSGYLSTATDECTRQFLSKIYAIVGTRNLYEGYVSDKFFVAVVGLEDVGKTSFIKVVAPPGSIREDEVGRKVHTKEVKPYKLNNGLILVDFPGSNGMSGEFDRWFEAFTAMPSIIVLLLNFEHDIKKDQVELYEGFCKRTGSPILAVFNKVDKLIDTEYSKSYFSDLQNDYAAKLKCSSDRVFFAQLSPDKSTAAKEEVVNSLKEAGVVDDKGFMQKLEGFRQGMKNSFKQK